MHTASACHRGAVVFALAALVAHAAAAAGDAGLDVLAKQLKEPDAAVRRQAVTDLVQLKTKESWELVVGALADRSPLVADEAQWSLGGKDPLALAALTGKNGLNAKDAAVRQRALDALGRIEQAVHGDVLTKLLSDRSPDVRLAALRALDRLATGKYLEDASRAPSVKRIEALLKSEKVDHVRATAIVSSWELKPFDLAYLSSLRTSDDGVLVEAALTWRLASISGTELVKWYKDKMGAMGFPAARIFVARLDANKTLSTTRSLVSTLEWHPDLRLKWVTVEILRDRSGQGVAVDEKFWRKWVDALPSDWTPATRPAGDPARPYESKAELFGVPVISNRLAILVDMTGWTDGKDATGALNKIKLKKEIGALLDALPENSRFRLIPYAVAPEKCGPDSLLENRAEPIKQALTCLTEAVAKGKDQDNFLDAAQVALDSNVDTILVVTDSAPMGSTHVHPDLVREAWMYADRLPGAFLEVVLMSADEAVEKQWSSLAAFGGGPVTKVVP